MAVFARIVEEEKIWSRLQDPGWWHQPDFLFSVLKDLLPRGDGVSLWRVDDHDDPLLERIVAAYRSHPQQAKFEETVIRFVDESELPSGIAPEKTKHNGRDPTLDSLHYELKKLSGADALKLVDLLRSAKPKIYTKTKVAKLVARSITDEHISY